METISNDNQRAISCQMFPRDKKTFWTSIKESAPVCMFINCETDVVFSSINCREKGDLPSRFLADRAYLYS
jgi:hypothetical protein